MGSFLLPHPKLYWFVIIARVIFS